MTEVDDTPTSKRLRILEPGEIDALYARRRFLPDEWRLYFILTAPERAALSDFRSLPSQHSPVSFCHAWSETRRAIELVWRRLTFS